MSRWTIDFGATAEGKVVLLLEPLDRGKAETLTLDLNTARSLLVNLAKAIKKAKLQEPSQ